MSGLVLLFFLLGQRTLSDLPPLGYGLVHDTEQSDTVTAKLLFVGDIMLARDVENKMKTYGATYPYHRVKALFAEHDYVIGNFESAMVAPHRSTPIMEMVFATESSFIPALAGAGITHLSLANNHATDYGPDGYTLTRQTLAESSISSFGHPTLVSSSSVTYISFGSRVVALVGLNDVGVPLDMSGAESVLAEASNRSDHQIVFIHWGEEYTQMHNHRQQDVATALSDWGVDLVVGHHPHVVQDVRWEGNTLVFYSLGNFIFDQYFSDNVQEGLTLSLELRDDKLTLDLFPVSTHGARTAPALMPAHERDKFLQKLSNRSDPLLADSILAGRIQLPLAP